MDARIHEDAERVFARLGKDLSATTSAIEAADIILTAADQLIGWEAGYVILYDPEQGGRPRPLLTVDTIENKRVRIPDVAPQRASTNMLRAIDEDGFLSLHEQDRELDPSMTFGDRTRKAMSQMFVPVRRGTRTIGVLSVQSYQKHAYTANSLETLKALSNHCAGALDRIWAQEALSHMVDRLKALYGAAHAVSASLDAEQLYEAVLATVEAVMPCDDFVIDGYDPLTNEVVPIYAVEYPRTRVWTERYLADHGLSGHIVHSGESVLLNSLDEMNASGIGFEFYGSSPVEQTQAIVAVPMILHGKVTGMMSAQSYKPNAYTRDDQALLALLASHTAIAIENARLFTTIQRVADTDPLTGVLSRRKFYELAERDFSRSTRYEERLTAIMLDIDNFKALNDRFGHKVGDSILQILARQLRANIRTVDILCRHGGEEFVLILPNTELQTAVPLAERLRSTVEGADLSAARQFFEAAGGSKSDLEDLRVTISIGVAEYDPSCATLDILIDRADRAMYAAKHAGKNQVKNWAVEV